MGVVPIPIGDRTTLPNGESLMIPTAVDWCERRGIGANGERGDAGGHQRAVIDVVAEASGRYAGNSQNGEVVHRPPLWRLQ